MHLHTRTAHPSGARGTDDGPTGRLAQQDYALLDLSGQGQAVGINMISLAGHACLPSIYTQVPALLYALFAALGPWSSMV